MPEETSDLITEKAVQLGVRLAAVQAVGITGSRARGGADAYSDVDVCVFVGHEYPARNIRAQTYTDLGFKEPLYFDVDFDTSRGDGFWVDQIRCDFNWMIIEKVRAYLAGLEENFGCSEWLPGGLASLKSLRDPHNVIQQLQAEIPPYPPARSAYRIQKALQEAHFSLYGLEWLPKAAYRGDEYSFLKYQYLLIEKLFYVLFALNRVWFSDEKRLVRRLMNFELVPLQAGKRIQAIIMHTGGNENLEHCLREMKTLFADTAQIAHQYFPNLDLPLGWK